MTWDETCWSDWEFNSIWPAREKTTTRINKITASIGINEMVVRKHYETTEIGLEPGDNSWEIKAAGWEKSRFGFDSAENAENDMMGFLSLIQNNPGMIQALK